MPGVSRGGTLQPLSPVPHVIPLPNHVGLVEEQEVVRRSFNRDPESAATSDAATCRERRWQPTAGSAFALRHNRTFASCAA
jgi:hypothetical protein